MSESSTQRLAQELSCWCRENPCGFAAVTYGSEISRMAAQETLASCLEFHNIPFENIELPVHRPAEEVLEAIHAGLSRATGAIICISGLAQAFANDQQMASGIGQLNHRRDEFASLPNWQVWWLSERIDTSFTQQAPDFNAWFSARFALEDEIGTDNIDEIEAVVGRSRSKQIENARQRAHQSALNLRIDLPTGNLDPQNSLDACLTASRALFHVGLVEESREMLRSLMVTVAEQFGWGNGPNDEIVSRFLADPRLSKSTEVASIYQQLAKIYLHQGDLFSARLLYERALSIRQNCLGEENPQTVSSMACLAGVLRAEGNYPDAIVAYRSAIAASERSYGDNDPHTATCIDNLGKIFFVLNRLAEALPLCERALHIRERALGPYDKAVGISLSNVANILRRMGKLEPAIALYERALGIAERTLGPLHNDTATIITNIATVYESIRQADRALPLYERALEIRQRALGVDHPQTATSLVNLANVLCSHKRYGEAQDMALRALRIQEKTRGPKHEATADALKVLATIQSSLGAYEDAIQNNRRALEIYRDVLGPNHINTAATSHNLAANFYRMHEYSTALEYAHDALTMIDQRLAVSNPNRLGMMRTYATILRSMGRVHESDEILSQIEVDKNSTAGPIRED